MSNQQKRPAADSISKHLSSASSGIKKSKQVAKVYVQNDIQVARITFKFAIKEKSDLSPDEIALSLIGSLLQTYQAQDPTCAILPWNTKDTSTLHPLTEPGIICMMEISKFRSQYTDRFRPKLKQNCWFCMAIAHTCPSQHLLSGNLSNLASWFDTNDCGAWLCTVQGSDDIVQVGDLLYGGPFINVARVTHSLQQLCESVCKSALKFGCRISKSSEIPRVDARPSNWMLAENQIIKVEADRRDVKTLKHVLYKYLNKQPDFRLRPGQYNVRFLPDKAQMLLGTKGALTRINTLRKHSAVIRSLTIVKSADIKHLDLPVTINGIEYTLRSVILGLTFPLHPPDGEESPRALFHSVDIPSHGSDAERGIVYFTVYHDQADVAERLVAILPAYVQTHYNSEAAKQWFQPGALNALGDVTFSRDDAGNWDGTWSTAEDELAQDLLDEDMGIPIVFEDIPDMESQMVLLTADDASVDTFGTAIGAKANQSSQLADSAIPAAAKAVVTDGGDGSAV